MIKVTNREIAAIAVFIVLGTIITAFAMSGFDVALAAKLIAKRIAAGTHDGIIAAAIIIPIAIVIRHAVVLPAYDANATATMNVERN